MRIPTVRVKHPAAGFATINAADFDAGRHELHDEQAPDFDPAHLPREAASARLDPAVRDAAAALCLRMVAFRRRVAGLPFPDLKPAEQIAVLEEAEAEFAAAVASHEDDQRERAAYEAQQRQEQQQDDREDDAADEDALRVAKGPGGRWFVWSGEERVSKGYLDEAEARNALAAMRAEKA